MSWELSVGFYPGILFGVRSYRVEGISLVNHVFYLPFVDICLTVYKEEEEKEDE